MDDIILKEVRRIRREKKLRFKKAMEKAKKDPLVFRTGKRTR